MAKPTYYEVLGIPKTATADEVKAAYRTLAREYHPDVNSSPDAEARFKEINAAYDNLSDSLKRADYDQSLGDSGVRSGGSGVAAEGYAGAAAPTYNTSPDRQSIMRAAYARVAVNGAIGAVAGAVIMVLSVAVQSKPFSPTAVALGAFPGLFVGILWGADYNFKVETFLGSGWIARSYTFARTVVMSLALAYYAATLGHAIDQLNGGQTRLVAPPLILLAILVGAVAGSDGDTPEKLRSGPGRFNLFYTLIRGGEIGLIGAVIGAALGGILAIAGYQNLFAWSAFIGFSLGMIVGSIKPPNLAAYASYASASVKNVIVMLMVVLAVLVGVGVGIAAGPAISTALNGESSVEGN